MTYTWTNRLKPYLHLQLDQTILDNLNHISNTRLSWLPHVVSHITWRHVTSISCTLTILHGVSHLALALKITWDSARVLSPEGCTSECLCLMAVALNEMLHKREWHQRDDFVNRSFGVVLASIAPYYAGELLVRETELLGINSVVCQVCVLLVSISTVSGSCLGSDKVKTRPRDLSHDCVIHAR